jgi:DUF1680 family protein
MTMCTDYQWHGRVEIRLLDTPDEPWTLTLRVPQWCKSATVGGPDGAGETPASAGSIDLFRHWQTDDRIVLDLDLPVRVTEPDPRVDAVRGCIAVERGPLVYCLESVDAPPQTELEDLRWDPRRNTVPVPRPDIAAAVVGITVPVVPANAGPRDLTAGAIPYFAWANRKVEGMRVWIPTDPLRVG